ncbi:MAG: excinuclease ABC subunit C [Gammaproteobacteria bacterium CG11_big_fil_rev_8_21_14_0_20_46_22]|nr:MAG: excinuclease ABC subunit C [Gammaproteobacteria bacterium CG12_big_fil_rev_8_21_14_0_65_46_12]PIR10630.1 MAG: excinuclease ABC subunit C [Gammaproteobacteria bacterium CG11_big_fil_rev_8_21_14_0_20_46_22]
MDNAEVFLKQLPTTPGVYQMYDAADTLLYVGKAKQLKKRVSSYFRSQLAPKTERLMQKVVRIEIAQTASETEALLLECELIKRHRPRYNILLRDDKSFPYLMLSDHRAPRLAFYRGQPKKRGHFFGPYPNSQAVRDTMELVQRVFLLRDCSDSYFSHRTRPCLQYQIKRCSAPCVGHISDEAYQRDVQAAVDFLTGREDDIVMRLTERMNAAATEMRYEEAAHMRDQIASIRDVQETQVITSQSERDVDIFSVAVSATLACVAVLMIRGGRYLGDRYDELSLPQENTPAEVLETFLSQYYLQSHAALPEAVLADISPEAMQLLLDAISETRGKRLKRFVRLSDEKKTWLAMAQKNAAFKLQSTQLKKLQSEQQFENLKSTLKLERLSRIECFDISHHQGEATKASNVVFNSEGPLKSDYRRYNIEGITPGDDYAAMRQAITRRFKGAKRACPEVLLIDGGKGQVHAAYDALCELELDNAMILMGIKKGDRRHAENDRILLHQSGHVIDIDVQEPARLLLQYLRDESHRFAINAHQKTKTKRQSQSILDEIPGIGAKRKKAILQHFGGLRGLQGKSAQEIAKVPGVSLALAQTIVDYLQK